MSDKIPSYVLNDYLKFERKIYSLFGINLGRSIPFKTLIYFGASAALLFGLAYVPIIGVVIGAIPLIFRLAIAGVIAYLLTDVGTENRAPVRFFESFIRFHWSQLKRETFYKGKVLPKPKTVRFNGITTVSYDKPISQQEADPVEKALPKPVIFKGVTYR